MRVAVLPLMASLGLASAASAQVQQAQPDQANADAEAQARTTRVVQLGLAPQLQQFMPELARRRVVFVGEQHSAYAHHLNQLAIIRSLHADNPRLAIGLEYFQRPFQEHLDAYVAGKITTRQLLVRTDYYARWSYDFRHYAPILEYAREHGIPLIALNVPTELLEEVRKRGLDGLNQALRQQLPEQVDRSNHRYRYRLKAVFDEHRLERGFETFHEVQLLWDETMAETAADYLRANPDTRMVILAGHGHLAYGDGIPDRLQRRLPVDSAIVLNDWPGPYESDLADYLLLSARQELPPAGQLGLVLDPGPQGLRISGFAPDSPSRQAGVVAGDMLVGIDGEQVATMSEVMAMLWDKEAGARVQVRVRRAGQELSMEIALAEPAPNPLAPPR